MLLKKSTAADGAMYWVNRLTRRGMRVVNNMGNNTADLADVVNDQFEQYRRQQEQDKESNNKQPVVTQPFPNMLRKTGVQIDPRGSAISPAHQGAQKEPPMAETNSAKADLAQEQLANSIMSKQGPKTSGKKNTPVGLKTPTLMQATMVKKGAAGNPPTFAEYLINHVLPSDIRVTTQLDKKSTEKLLIEVARKHPDDYDRVVTGLKKLGDTWSTYDPVTMGIEEISTPNKEKRDAIVRKYQAQLEKDLKTGDKNTMLRNLEAFQGELAKNDLDGTKDDASTMVRSALTSNKYQLMKLRTSPGVVSDNDGNIVPIIFPKSYAEGVDPIHFWLGAMESRKNIATGQVNTAKPGEMSKIISNVLNSAVVSRRDCGTKQGLAFPPRDDAIVGRYLARDVPQCGLKRNDKITSDVQQELLRKQVREVIVRSPQTCEAPDGSVCQLCMGMRNSTEKDYEIGDAAGLITSGNIGEPLTQMALSAKHSTSLAGVHEGLRGEPGFRKLVEMPKNYSNRKVLCEVLGTIVRIRPAPQGGQIITIRQTRPVPERYIVYAMPTPNIKQHWDYHIPPTVKIAKGIKEGVEVYPGMELSTGIDNLKDVARLRNLGFTRSVAAENMYQVYKHTGQTMDRRHFELLARAAHPYVRIVRAPASASFVPGEVVTYEDFVREANKLPKLRTSVVNALGKVLGTGVLDLTVGTEIDAQVQRYLTEHDVRTVETISGLEVAPETLPLSRVVNQRKDWISALGHRYLKNQLIDAATYGKKSNIHGYNPITAYAYGAEMRQGADGTY